MRPRSLRLPPKPRVSVDQGPSVPPLQESVIAPPKTKGVGKDLCPKGQGFSDRPIRSYLSDI